MTYNDEKVIDIGAKHHAKALDRRAAASFSKGRIRELERLCRDANDAIQSLSLSGDIRDSYAVRFQMQFNRLVFDRNNE